MKSRQRIAAAFAAIAGGALVATACAPGGGGGGTADPSAGTSAEPSEAQTVTGADYNPQPRDALEAGGEVVYSMGQITPQQNSSHADGQVTTSVLAAYFRPQLVQAEPDGTPVLNPNYLVSREVTEVDGNTVITDVINDKAIWNDDTPIDVTAYQTSWTALRSFDDGYVPGAIDGYSQIASVEAGGSDKEVVITFDGIYPWTDFMFSGLLHPSINTPEEFNEGFMNNPRSEIGAGPYVVETFDVEGGRVVFVPNEKWWGDEPLLQKVTFRQLETVAALNAFKANETNMSPGLTADNLAQVEGQENTTVYRAQRASKALLTLDSKKEQFKDLAVRDAIFRAVDRDQIKQVIWQGLDYTEPDLGSFAFYPFEPEYKDSLRASGWEFSVEEANRILDEEGWERGDDDIRSKDGVRFTANFPTFGDDPIVEARARVIQQQMAAIGLEVVIDARPSSDFTDVINGTSWDMLLSGFASGSATGVQFICQTYCSDSQLNKSSTGNESIDERLEALKKLPTKAEQNAAGIELEAEILKETRGIFPLYSGAQIVSATTGLANLTPEAYTGLDLYGVRGVEHTGFMQDMVP